MRYAHLSPDVRRDAVRLLDVRERLVLSYRRTVARLDVLIARERTVRAYGNLTATVAARVAA